MIKGIKKLLMRRGFIKCNHKYLPIRYGYLQRFKNEKGEIITNPEIKGYFEGGCCYGDNYPNYKCVICGKETK
jgi:hypothetical protein